MISETHCLAFNHRCLPSPTTPMRTVCDSIVSHKSLRHSRLLCLLLDELLSSESSRESHHARRTNVLGSCLPVIANRLKYATVPFFPVPANMDYSHLAQDPDHPEGTSPWNTSPRHSTRPSFNASGDQPPSPLPSATYPKSGLEDSLGDNGIFGAEGHYGQVEPDTPKNTQSNQPGGTVPEQVDGRQQQTQHITQTSPHPTQQEHPGRPSAAARHAGANRMHRPQHKLQAKITGLERTGRKDPILRFDVHVRGPPIVVVGVY